MGCPPDLFRELLDASPNSETPCPCCRQRPAETYYALCRVCYADESNRDSYSRRPYRRTAPELDRKVTGLPPRKPTSAPPRSAEKEQVLAGRVERCEQLHHPDDAFYRPMPEDANPLEPMPSDEIAGTVGALPDVICLHGMFLLFRRMWGPLVEGIERSGSRWRVRPRRDDGSRVNLGTFDTLPEAILAARRYWEDQGRTEVESGEQYRGGPPAIPREPIPVRRRRAHPPSTQPDLFGTC